MVSNPGGKRAVFLDRDGTVNILKPGEYVFHKRDLRLHNGAAQAIRSLNLLGYLVIIVTNQGVVAREKASEKTIEEFHEELIKRLKKKGVKLDAIYYCPHHPDGTHKKLGIVCKCRKPEIGMIKEAAKKFKIDLKRSFLVGDSTSDIAAGNKAGLTTIAVKTGYAGKDGKHKAKPDLVARNLPEAVKLIRGLALLTGKPK